MRSASLLVLQKSLKSSAYRTMKTFFKLVFLNALYCSDGPLYCLWDWNVSHWLDIHQSNSFRTTFANNGLRIPPCGTPFPVFLHLQWALSAFWRGYAISAYPEYPVPRAVSTVFHDWRCRRIPWYQHRLQNENLIGLPKTWLLQWRGAHCGLGEIHSCAYRILLHISAPAPVWYTAGWFGPLLWVFPEGANVHPVLVSLLCGLHEDENFVIFSEHRKTIHSGPFLPFVQWWSYLYPLSCSPCSSW